MNIDQGKTQYSEEEQDGLRGFVREHMAQRGVSQAQVSREAEIADSTLSQFLSGTYRGNTQEIARKLARWLSARNEEATLRSLAPPEPTFTQTPTTDKVIGVLRGAQALGDIGLVTGPAGVGKTAGALKYQTISTRTVMATASPAISSAVGILKVLLSRAPGNRGHALAKLDLTIQARETFGAGWLIIIDEAQHLQVEALEELRAIHDETKAGLVLMGNNSVLSRIEGNARSPAFAQLFSRAGIRVTLKGNAPEEITAVAATMGVTDPTVLAQVQEIGAKDNLRVVVKALRLAQMSASGGKENLNSNHVRLAYRQLGGLQARA